MNRALLRSLSMLSIVCGITLLAVACSTAKHVVPLDSQSAANEREAVKQISQLRFGDKADYSLCVEPACPTVTRKTLAARPASQVSVPPVSVKEVATTEQVADTVEATVHFDSGSATLTTDAQSTLGKLLPALHQANKVTLSGRTDSTGSTSLNQSLAAQRVQAVRKYLIHDRAGLDARIVADAQGNCCFVAPNTTQQGRFQNRRVDIAIDTQRSRPPSAPK